MAATVLSFEAFFLGSAKVNLDNLRLDDPPGRASLITQKPRIDKLVRRFKSNGCDRLQRANHIGALISRELLEGALRNSKYGSIEQLRLTPLVENCVVLDLPSLLYYDGQARVEATRRYFSNPHDHWWVVDLYDSNIGPKFAISERARNNESTRNAAGVVFREYLEMVARKDDEEADKLALGLSADELKEAKSICKRPKLMAAFIALKDIPGLWSTLKGGLHRSSAKGCDEELIHYLYFIRDVWLEIVTDQNMFVEIDPQTIALLESRAPGLSYNDREHVRQHMRNEKLFPAVGDGPTRTRLESRLMSIKVMIPTLKTYSKDTMHLHQIVKVLRLLLGPNGSRLGSKSIRSALRAAWTGPSTSSDLRLEDNDDGNIVKLTLMSVELDCFEISLQIIILFAMRNYTMMINASAKTTPGRDKAPITEPNPRYLYLYAKTARAVGFRTDQIESLLRMDYVRRLLEEFLEKAAPQERWLYDLKAAVDRLSLEFQQIIMEKRNRCCSELQNAAEVKVVHRCGRPLDEDSTQDSDGLFLKNIIMAPELHRQGVTSSFVRTEFFRRFWDPPQLSEGDFSVEVEMGDTSIEETPTKPVTAVAQSRVTSEIRSNEDFDTLRRELAVAREEIENLRNQSYEAVAQQQSINGENVDSSSVYSNDPIAQEWSLRDEDRITEYTSQLAQLNHERDELRNSNELKSATITRLEAQIAAHDETIKRWLDEKDLLRHVEEEKLGALQMQIDAFVRERNQSMIEVVKHVEYEATLRSKLEDLQNQITFKNNNILSLETELSSIKQRDWYPSDEEEREHNQSLLEQRVKNLRAEIALATDRLETIPKLKDQVRSKINDLTNPETSKIPLFATEGQASDLKDLESRLRNLEREKSDLEQKIPIKTIQLVYVEFDLLSKRRGEALFFEMDVSGEIMSPYPSRVPIRENSLEKKFKDLLEGGYEAWCFIDKEKFQVNLSDSLQWRGLLAHPPTVDGASFYTKRRYKHAMTETIDDLEDSKRRRLYEKPEP